MPCYRIRLSGSGISYPFVEGGDPIIGFFTACEVRARNEDAACTAAWQQVLAEWQPGDEYAAHNRGGLPSLRVEDV